MSVEKKEIEVEVERGFSLITNDGKEILVQFKLDEGADNFVLDEARTCLESNSIWCPEDWVDIKFGNEIIAEIDMKKIIGIKWY